MKRMTQSEIVDHLVANTSLDRKQVAALFAELASLAQTEALAGREFVIPGFGTLVLSQRAQRQGRNPATGESITIPAKQALKVRVARTLATAALGEQTAASGGDNTTGSDT